MYEVQIADCLFLFYVCQPYISSRIGTLGVVYVVARFMDFAIGTIYTINIDWARQLSLRDKLLKH